MQTAGSCCFFACQAATHSHHNSFLFLLMYFSVTVYANQVDWHFVGGKKKNILQPSSHQCMLRNVSKIKAGLYHLDMFGSYYSASLSQCDWGITVFGAVWWTAELWICFNPGQLSCPEWNVMDGYESIGDIWRWPGHTKKRRNKSITVACSCNPWLHKSFLLVSLLTFFTRRWTNLAVIKMYPVKSELPFWGF